MPRPRWCRSWAYESVALPGDCARSARFTQRSELATPGTTNRTCNRRRTPSGRRRGPPPGTCPRGLWRRPPEERRPRLPDDLGAEHVGPTDAVAGTGKPENTHGLTRRRDGVADLADVEARLSEQAMPARSLERIRSPSRAVVERHGPECQESTCLAERSRAQRILSSLAEIFERPIVDAAKDIVVRQDGEVAFRKPTGFDRGGGSRVKRCAA